MHPSRLSYTMAPMDEVTPQPVAGSVLLAQRKREGVAQKDLADALGIHRTRLNAWEKEPELDTIRATKYRKALAALVAKAIR